MLHGLRMQNQEFVDLSEPAEPVKDEAEQVCTRPFRERQCRTCGSWAELASEGCLQLSVLTVACAQWSIRPAAAREYHYQPRLKNKKFFTLNLDDGPDSMIVR